MNLQKRAEQFLLDQDQYKAVTFLNKVTSNTTNSTYIYFMAELTEPVEFKRIDGSTWEERYEVIYVRISDHEHRDHVNSEWYSNNRVISSDDVDYADDLEEAKEIALGI